jgi:hypothetical protein
LHNNFFDSKHLLSFLNVNFGNVDYCVTNNFIFNVQENNSVCLTEVTNIHYPNYNTLIIHTMEKSLISLYLLLILFGSSDRYCVIVVVNLQFGV